MKPAPRPERDGLRKWLADKSAVEAASGKLNDAYAQAEDAARLARRAIATAKEAIEESTASYAGALAESFENGTPKPPSGLRERRAELAAAEDDLEAAQRAMAHLKGKQAALPGPHVARLALGPAMVDALRPYVLPLVAEVYELHAPTHLRISALRRIAAQNSGVLHGVIGGEEGRAMAACLAWVEDTIAGRRASLRDSAERHQLDFMHDAAFKPFADAIEALKRDPEIEIPGFGEAVSK